MPYSAKIIADSLNSVLNTRLTTFEITYPKFVHNEIMTHRMFSRNTASSRAIPYAKTRAQVVEDPVMPVWWGKNQKGMQAKEELTDQFKDKAVELWLEARDTAIIQADALQLTGIHKQILNRIIEPFMWITAIVTATDYDNFFHLRCHPNAQPEIRRIADMMHDLYYSDASRNAIQPMVSGSWHLPYIKAEDWVEVGHDGTKRGFKSLYAEHEALMHLCMVSTARCARVSYLTHTGTRDHSEDLRLFEDLRSQGHWSPFEHVATPYDGVYKFKVSRLMPTAEGYFANLKGWIQFRRSFPEEYCTEFVPQPLTT